MFGDGLRHHFSRSKAALTSLAFNGVRPAQ